MNQSRWLGHLGGLLGVALLLTAGEAAGAERELLIHWSFDEGAGEASKDASGNGLHGAVRAAWTASPSGQALVLDGTPRATVSVKLPERQRFGTASWSFMAWVKPQQLTIDSKQNQRRIFSFGEYPDAYLVIDLTGDGRLNCYFSYRDDAGQIVSTGGSSSTAVQTGQWAHVALVCDRQEGKIWLYVNGYCPAPATMRPDFAGDFVRGGTLTVGSGWQNYWGVMDEVKIYRRALSREEVRAEFLRLHQTFEVEEPAEAAAFHLRESIAGLLASVNNAWAAKDFGTVRKQLARVVVNTEAPPQMRSYAHLRAAQSFLAEGNATDAARQYQRIAAEAAYPAVHRFEAQECFRELQRAAQGLPPRDPAARRTSVPQVTEFAAEVFVAPDGDDSHDGSAEQPFATLDRARDEVRAIRGRGIAGPVGVRIRPGQYVMKETLALTREDSGTADAPVVYRAEQPGTSVLYGGRKLSGFQPVTEPTVLERLPEESRGRVWQCDLKSLGITDYGTLRVRGFAQSPSPPTLELFVDGRPMTLARWPNEGFVGIRKLVQSGSRAEKQPSVFEYESDRHERWTRAEDAWLFGYFHFLWADATIKIGAIDPAARTVTTAEAYHYGGRGMDAGQGIVYYAFNLLEEIDQPGEWYLNRTTGVLYLYPPSDLNQSSIEIGMLSTPMIALDRVSHVRFEGLVLDLARYNGVHCIDSDHCLFAGCTVSRMAGNGIAIQGGRASGLLGCDIHTLGRRGVELIGGDRATLTPAGHFIENCQIHSFARIDRTYTPAIQLEGVGNRVAYNLMHNSPSSVMRIEGNDHVVEFNEVHSAVRESDDQGAIDIFRNPTYRGNIFRYNHFHHLGKPEGEVQVHGQAAIRFDDAISGQLVYGNVFHRAANGNFGAIQMNSGRDNVIDNNLFADCKIGVSGGWNRGNNVWRQMREGEQLAGFYQTELYLSRYPEMSRMLDDPGINFLWRNVFFRCGQTTRGNAAYLELIENAVFTDADADPGFTDADAGDFRLRPDATLRQSVGFHPIPLDEIGLYHDAYRATWPVETTASAPN
ncbi:MAG: right-handed parallel beta-helix repeat-containing protein [Pirellulaceae bacterium]|nr:right-handed parallel beta-helix repeat-containing protein [Pirellulaceae bacterium]